MNKAIKSLVLVLTALSVLAPVASADVLLRNSAIRGTTI